MPLSNHRRAIQIGLPPLGNKSLSVPQIMQEADNWCWAACADMVLHYYNDPNAKQCEFANWLLNQVSCCSNPKSAACDKPCSVNDVGRVFRQWNVGSNSQRGTVPFSTLKNEVNANRPVEVAYAWNGGRGHVALVVGWLVVNGRNAVRVNDPAYGSVGVYYDSLLTAYGLGQWFWTWTGIRR